MGFIKNLFRAPAPPKLPPPPRPVSSADPTVALAAAANAARTRQSSGGGFSNTIRTSPQGALGVAPVARVSLLGGSAQ